MTRHATTRRATATRWHPHWLAAGACCAALLGACTAYVDRRAEDAIAQALPRLLGPARRYDVSVEGANAAADRFARVRVAGQRIQRPGQPAIDALEVELSDVTIDRERKALVAVGNAEARVRLQAVDVAQHLVQRGWVDKASVRFLPPDGVVVSGRPRIAGLMLPPGATAEFRGHLFARGAQLRLGIDALRLGPVQAPPLALSVIEQIVNPLFDASGYAVPARIDAIEVQGDALAVRASGTGPLPGV